MNHRKLATSRLIAHRGFSSHYPENTLRAFREAFECGACYVECDVQLTKDKVPVLLHDNDLLRTSGVPAKIHEMIYSELRKFTAGFSGKFGERFAGEKVPSLEEFVSLLTQWPERKAFVELKRSSIRGFGSDEVLQNILPLLEVVVDRVILISFDADIISELVKSGKWKTGWVIDQWSDAILEQANSIDPGYLFVDVECVPAELTHFGSSNWQWVVYEVDDPEQASKWISFGAGYVETNDIKRLLDSGVFVESDCAE